MVEIGTEEFDALVERALDGIPEELASLVHNVVVLIEEEPPPGEPELLGLYDGVALTDRQANHAALLPDQIFVYRGPLRRFTDSVQDLQAEIEITVVHEIAHHFGIDDARLHQLGYA